MEITTASLISLSKLLGDWVSRITNKFGERKRENIAALNSVQDALTITRSYIAHRDRGGHRDYDKEEELSKLWNSASSRLYEAGEVELAEKCSLKGYYWASPDSWIDSEYSGAEIEVNKVFNDVQRLLRDNT